MTTHIEKVESLIEAWKRNDIEAVLELVHDDVEYHYVVGLRPLSGKAWVRKFLEKFGSGKSNIQWRINTHAETGDKLLVEGVDDFVDADGVRVQMPYMGIFEFRDGLIYRWRDYADASLIDRAKAGEPFPEWLEALVG
jgi:limonene-1,2-epoxide hydrolase